jgi:hypothetical protein
VEKPGDEVGVNLVIADDRPELLAMVVGARKTRLKPGGPT